MNDDLCLYWKTAVDQRKTEVERGLGFKGTMGYEKNGCYKCDGYGYVGCNSKITNAEINEPSGDLEETILLNNV